MLIVQPDKIYSGPGGQILLVFFSVYFDDAASLGLFGQVYQQSCHHRNAGSIGHQQVVVGPGLQVRFAVFHQYAQYERG